MSDDLFRITILGARGSIPVSGKDFIEYGGDTSCYMVELGNQVVFLDAGTGIVNAPNLDGKENIYVILSHPHLDHIIGLPFFPELSKKDKTIVLYGKNRGGRSIGMQIEKAFAQPYWPLTIAEYPSNCVYKDIKLPLELKDGDRDIHIDGIEVNHPGGNLGFSVKYADRKLVYLTDCELNSDPSEEFIEFCKDSDLLLFDAQYTQEEYKTKKGFGHSTVETAIPFMEKTHSKKMVIIHHDPKHDDKFLKELENSLNRDDIIYAKSGMSIDIL